MRKREIEAEKRSERSQPRGSPQGHRYVSRALLRAHVLRRDRERGRRSGGRNVHAILQDDNEGFNRGLAIDGIAREMENLPRNYSERDLGLRHVLFPFRSYSSAIGKNGEDRRAKGLNGTAEIVSGKSVVEPETKFFKPIDKIKSLLRW